MRMFNQCCLHCHFCTGFHTLLSMLSQHISMKIEIFVHCCPLWLGKQLFEQDSSMENSDAAFLEGE